MSEPTRGREPLSPPFDVREFDDMSLNAAHTEDRARQRIAELEALCREVAEDLDQLNDLRPEQQELINGIVTVRHKLLAASGDPK